MHTVKVQDFSFIYYFRFQSYASENSGSYYNTLSFDPVRLISYSALISLILNLAVSIAGIICEKLGVLCPADGYSADHAEVYLDAVDFVSIR